jgi:hypothetical protein
MIAKDTWVLIHRIILPAAERAAVMPDDTKQKPFEMWVKGRLCTDTEAGAELGAEVEVITRTGRRERGTLLEANPAFTHGFGEYIPELLRISEQVRDTVFPERAAE